MPGKFTKHEASTQANLLEAYWLRQGYRGIRVWLERRKDTDDAAEGWEIRSNIGPHGYPPKEQVAA